MLIGSKRELMIDPRPSSADASAYLELDDARLIAQCEVDTYRASGPGGQKRNKTDSAVRIRHQPTGLIVTAVESRSQHENRARALRRLRQAIALQVRRPLDPETYTPSELLRACISARSKICVGRRDTRYPLAVQEILDCLQSNDTRLPATAACLGVTTATLSKFFHEDPKLWRRVNEMRAAAGAKSLR